MPLHLFFLFCCTRVQGGSTVYHGWMIRGSCSFQMGTRQAVWVPLVGEALVKNFSNMEYSKGEASAGRCYVTCVLLTRSKQALAWPCNREKAKRTVQGTVCLWVAYNCNRLV